MDSTVHTIFAANLKHFMARKGLKQMALAEKSGVAQTTISNYLNPERRLTGKTGKPASAKLTEIEAICGAGGARVAHVTP